MWNEYQNICLFRLWRASEYTAAGNETAILMVQSNDFFCFRTKNHLFFAISPSILTFRRLFSLYKHNL